MNFSPSQQSYLTTTIARMKREILFDMGTGKVDPRVKDFAELQGAVDANEYGGLTEESDDTHFKGLDLLRQHFTEPETDTREAGWILAINHMQAEVSRWLEQGEHLKELPAYRAEFPRFGVMDVVIPEGWVDQSHHDDAMPSFSKGRLILWVDFPEEHDREDQSRARFGLGFDAGAVGDSDLVDVCESDDFQEILAAIEQHRALALEPLPDVREGRRTIDENASDFPGFMHNGRLVLNPTLSEDGLQVIDPERYGFEWVSTGGGLTGWSKEVGDTELLLTDIYGESHDLGAVGAPFLIGIRQDGYEIALHAARVGIASDRLAPDLRVLKDLGLSLKDIGIDGDPKPRAGIVDIRRRTPDPRQLPGRFKAEPDSSRPMIHLTDTQTGKSVAVPRAVYDEVQSVLRGLFNDEQPPTEEPSDGAGDEGAERPRA